MVKIIYPNVALGICLFISTFSGRKWIVASWIKTFWSCSYGCQVRDHNHLTIISAYQVCQTTIKNVGLKTNTMQQWQRLEEKNLEDKNIRELMIRDLANFINNLQQHKYEVIVEIDSNESNDQPKNRVDTLLHFTKLIDIISQQHGIKKEPNTRLSGSKCIEFVLCSKHISLFIDKCGITLFNEIKFSDHRGLFLDLHLTSFLKNNASHQIFQCPKRDQLQSPCTTSCRYPLDHRTSCWPSEKYIQQHRFFQRSQHYQQTRCSFNERNDKSRTNDKEVWSPVPLVTETSGSHP